MWANVTDSNTEEPGAEDCIPHPIFCPMNLNWLTVVLSKVKAGGRLGELGEIPLRPAKLHGLSASALQGPGTGDRIERVLLNMQIIRVELESKGNSSVTKKLACLRKLGSSAMKRKEIWGSPQCSDHRHWWIESPDTLLKIFEVTLNQI